MRRGVNLSALRVDDVEFFIEEKATDKELLDLQDLIYKKVEELKSRNVVKEKDRVILKPKKANGKTIKITPLLNSIGIRGPVNSDLYDIITQMGYFRDKKGHFFKDITEINGSVEDRTADLACTLLDLGYEVELDVNDIDTISLKIKERDFSEDITKVIGFDVEKDAFTIKWNGFNNKLYQKARSIRGSKWDAARKRVLVPSRNFLEIQDYAEKNKFFITDDAMYVINKFGNAPVVDMVDVSTEDVSDKIDILEDLLDD